MEDVPAHFFFAAEMIKSQYFLLLRSVLKLSHLMKLFRIALVAVIAASAIIPYNAKGTSPLLDQPAADTSFIVEADKFADVAVLRYQIDGFENLSLKHKQLAYYLYQAGLSGRDIFYDQKHSRNLEVRKVLEGILESYKGNKDTDDYKKFLVYAKRFFFSNGLHHHYSNVKLAPGFNFEYFRELVRNSDPAMLPLQGKTPDELASSLSALLFDPSVNPKNVDLSPDIDNIVASSNNLYEGVTQKEVEEFYKKMTITGKKAQPPYGLNSKLVKENGQLVEKVWKVGGMYGQAIERIVHWLEKAVTVAENDRQKEAFEKLIKFYKSGSLADYDQYCIAWVADTGSLIDFTNGFVEVYRDAAQKRGSYEAITSMKDLAATKRIEAISKQAQWFEDNSSIGTNHKKKNVVGISAKVITVINEVGDAAPSTPIGINLPNQEWIRETHGSKSVSLGNIVRSSNHVKSKSPAVSEFASSREVVENVKKYGALAGDLHTDMHEVIGHASGQINEGVGTTDVTLKNYAGTLEEARADLVALYYAMDRKLIEIGVMPAVEVGKASYDSYLMNALLMQLYRIQPGDNMEQAHMRNRQLVALWAYENGKKENVIERVTRDGKTYFRINDYDKLRNLFGVLLKEIQRIKSEGDFNAGKNLVETYAVKVDQPLLKEVHKRYENLNIAPYMGFIQPKLVPVMQNGQITDVKVEYPSDFVRQMLEYGKDYSLLPIKN